MLFKDLLEKTFGLDRPSSERGGLGGDPALKQGARFDKMQQEIIAGVLPSLPLMNKTTGPHLGSLEGGPLANVAEGFTVAELNTEEQRTLETNQRDLNRSLSDLAVARHHYAKELVRCKGGCEYSKLSVLSTKIARLNGDILTRATTISALVKKLQTTSKEVQTRMAATTDHMGREFGILQKDENEFSQLVGKQRTLTGDLANTQLNLGSQYYDYLLWFIAATTLGILSLHQLSKS